MIYGIGNDVLEIGRMKKLLTGRYAEAFMNRILTPAERRLAAERGKRMTEFVSGRFAAKEAVSKAFGCGIGRVMSFTDIEVLPDERDARSPHCRARHGNGFNCHMTSSMIFISALRIRQSLQQLLPLWRRRTNSR